MDIREYQPSDFEACARLYVEVFNAEPWKDQWTSEKAAAYLGDLAGVPGFEGTVIESSNGITGFLFGYKVRWWSSDQFVIKEMCVEGGLQRQGIGSRLLSNLKARLKRSGYSQVSLLTSRLAWQANFFRKNGFRENNFIDFMVSTL